MLRRELERVGRRFRQRRLDDLIDDRRCATIPLIRAFPRQVGKIVLIVIDIFRLHRLRLLLRHLLVRELHGAGGGRPG